LPVYEIREFAYVQMPLLLSSLEESFVSLSIRVEVLRHIYNLIDGDFRMFIKAENL
jgi:hypothetical protein